MVPVSVIVSTYNAAGYLEKVLAGLACQSSAPNEVVVADDGSTDETGAAIRRAAALSPFPIRHVRHEHEGFRKCRILNRAIEAASGDYLVFIDGDCLARKDFIEAHRRRARPRRFLSGGVVRLPRELSQALGRQDVASGNAFDRAWLRGHGFSASLAGKLDLPPRLARLFSRLSPTKATFNGHNSSAWRSDIVRVNGFDERMVYGGLDRELGERLENAGVRGFGVRYEAICLHLDHDRAYIDQEAWQANYALRDETKRRKLAWTPHGIRKSDAA